MSRRPASDEAVFPVSANQRFLLLLMRQRPSLRFQIPLTFDAQYRVEEDELRHALVLVTERHEVLRTRFVRHAGRHVQVVSPSVDVEWERCDLSGRDEDVSVKLGREAISEQTITPLDFSRRPPLRALALRMGDGRLLLNVVLHHLILDGWSAGLFRHELQHALGEVRGEEPPLPRLRIQYGDYASWEEAWLASPDGAARVREVAERLRGRAPVLTPETTERGSDGGGGTHVSALDPALLAGVDAMARAHRTTTFVTLLTAFDIALGAFSGASDVTVGTELANRTSVDVEQVIGFFANTVLIRLAMDSGLSFAELLARARDSMLWSFERQRVPLLPVMEKLLAEAGIRTGDKTTVVIQLLPKTGSAPGSAPTRGTSRLPLWRQARPSDEVLSSASFCDLHVQMNYGDSGMRVITRYERRVVSDETVSRLLTAWQRVTRAAVTDPLMKVDELRRLALAR